MILKNGQDTINGTEGSVIATIDGQVETLFYVKDFEANVDFNKEEVKFLGSRATHHKVTGWEGTGSMTIHYMTSLFRKIIIGYVKHATLPQMTLVGTNDDPASSLGRQTAVLKGVILDGSVITKLAAEDEVLDEDVDFTYEDVDLLDEFNKPIV